MKVLLELKFIVFKNKFYFILFKLWFVWGIFRSEGIDELIVSVDVGW